MHVSVTAELDDRTALTVGHVIVSPLAAELLMVTFPEKLNKLVRTMLTGTSVRPTLKFTRDGSEILKSPTETEPVAEWDAPPGDPRPVIVTT